MPNNNDFSLLPLHLHPTKAANPWPLIEAYFDYAHLTDTLPLINKLFTAAMDSEYCPVERHPGNLCFFVERLESLVYAAHLLLAKQNKNSSTGGEAITAVKQFFQYKSWPQWRLQLHELLQYALTGSSICQEHNPAELPAMQEQLTNLVMTMHELWYARNHPAGRRLTLPVTELCRHLNALLQPQLVYALTANGTGYTSLLFILPDSNTRPYKDYDELLQLAALHHPQVSISLHKYAAIHERLLAGHLFYSQACTRANLLYEGEGEPLPLPGKAALNALRRRAAAVFKKEFAMAATFLATAKTFIAQKDFTGSGFMLHQAAELCLRSLHMAFMGRELRSHSVQCLLQHTARFAPAVASVFPPGTEESNHLLPLLDAAYSEVRYNPAYRLPAKDAGILLTKITRLQGLAKGQFSPAAAV